MSTPTPSNRRRFLHDLTLLAAGAALVPATNLFCTGHTVTFPEQQWTNFCSLHKAKPYRKEIRQADGTLVQPSAGHTHKAGDAVYFPDQHILAQPTWVYWGTGKKPADVIITFFNDAGKKIRRVNRFELEALSLLCRQATEQQTLSAGSTALLPHLLEDRKKQLLIRTTVNKQHVLLSAVHRQTETSIKKTIHYNTQKFYYAS